MDTLKRIETILKELKELKKDIVELNKIIFDRNYFYVAIGASPYILIGRESSYAFYSMKNTSYSYSSLKDSGQKAIDEMVRDRFTIKVFSSGKEALQFMLDNM